MGQGRDSPQSSPGVGSETGGVDRRQLLGSAVLLGAMVGFPLHAWNMVRAGEDSGATPAEKLLLARLSDLVIPVTDTPGALAVGVPAFVALALRHGLDDTAPQSAGRVNMGNDHGGLPLLEDVGKQLDRQAGASFLDLPPDRQFAILESYDAAAFGGDQKDHPWKKIKALILTGYYTSEVGASRELQYELVPGRWDPDLPLASNNRSWSSDWTAVDFG
ncbi:gluconate 2-dehydrogenase subunit 3 family protein [Sphingobium sp.]|uniref:gluconate 2-dehydrogenase subunit 3 family protein n=1 Tax=Sphingobium sp. TaxID=1912891 RepID=UPI003B3A6DA4